MYAIVENGIVANIVVWDGNLDSWQPPAGTIAVQVTEDTGAAFIGGAYSSDRFSLPAATTASS